MAKTGATASAQAEVPATQEQGGALVVPSFAFMAMTTPEVIQENIGDEPINPFDLDRIKVPSGGMSSWEVPTLEGTQNMPKLEGIVVHWKSCRAYWEKDINAGEGATPPDCSSADGKVGIGNPGGMCALCPKAQFGSAPPKNGKPSNAQWCKAGRLLFFMTKDNVLPMIVAVPPTSIAPMKRFFMRLASKKIPYHGCVTQLALKKTANKGGIQYAQIEPSMVEKLNPAEAAMVKGYTDTIKVALDKVGLEKTDVEGDEKAQ